MSAGVGYLNSDRKSYYYFDNSRKFLFDIEAGDFYCFLRDRYGLLDKEIKEIVGAIKTRIWSSGIEIDPHVFAFYNEKSGVLYISNHNHGVYRLTGTDISLVDNGTDGVIFEYRSNYTPFHIDLNGLVGVNYFEKGFDWGKFQLSKVFYYVTSRANFAVEEKHNLTAEEQKYLLVIHLYSIFFESILQDKPILCFEGVKSSGKSFLATILGKILFGKNFLPSPLSENRKDFQVTLSKNYYIVFDNLDSTVSGHFLNDLCTIATSGEISSRKLYTDREEVKTVPRVFVVITSREPKFKRDDFVDRLLLFNTEKVKQPQSRASLNNKIMEHRVEIWAELLINLNSIVELLKQKADWNPPGIFRMADWELFGKKVHTDGNRDYFTRLLEKMNKEKSKFGVEDDPLYMLLQHIVHDQSVSIADKSASEMYRMLEEAAESMKMHEFARRYRSPTSMARRLANIKEELRDEFDFQIHEYRGRQKLYCIKKKEG